MAWEKVEAAQTLSSDQGIPDNHVITVRERRISIDFPTLIQNNISTDTITLDLDSEWNGISPVIIIGPKGSEVEIAWHGDAVKIPAQLMAEVGGIDVSVMGYDSTGAVRLVTVAANSAFTVVASGAFDGVAPEETAPTLLGQLIAAADDATQATKAANTATTEAKTATSAANTATTNANNATMAAKAATEAANTATNTVNSVVAQLPLPDGNVPKKTISGHVVTTDEAYAAPPVSVKVHGNTRQNLWETKSGTAGGVTVQENEDGSITLSGTITAVSAISLNTYVLKPGTKYTLSIDSVPSATAVENEGFYVGVNNSYRFALGANKTITFTTPDPITVADFGFMFDSSKLIGSQVSGTYHLMLNEGATAAPWCPPGLASVSELTLVTAGKNLLSGNIINGAGFTFSEQADGSITVTGQGNGDGLWHVAYGNFKLKPGTYTISEIKSNPESDSFSLLKIYGQKSNLKDGHFTFTVESENDEWRLGFMGSHNFISGTNYKFQIEVGSVATEYEPPQRTTTTVDLQGNEVCGVSEDAKDVLKVDSAGAKSISHATGKIVIDGTSSWGRENSNWDALCFFAQLSDVKFPKNESTFTKTLMLCDKLRCDMGVSTLVRSGRCGANITAVNGQACVYVNLTGVSGVSDLETFKTWLNDNPLTLVYESEEYETTVPGTIELPTLPAPNLTAWADTNIPTDIELEYIRDINIVLGRIESAIAAK